MGAIKYNIGDIFTTKEGYEVKIIDRLKVKGKTKYKVKFLDSFGYEKVVQSRDMSQGSVRNPYHKSVYGVGYLGVGKYNGWDNGKTTDAYEVWKGMIRRCYSEAHQDNNPTYIGTTISNEWLNFQNFAEFYYSNIPKFEGVKFTLDKDMLQQNVKNKIYSKETCIFVPIEINSFLTNNQARANTSGYTGVSENSDRKGFWRAQINDFETGKYICIKCNCKTKEEAHELYQEYRAKNAEKVKDYLRSLSYLPEEIIQLIK